MATDLDSEEHRLCSETITRRTQELKVARDYIDRLEVMYKTQIEAKVSVQCDLDALRAAVRKHLADPLLTRTGAFNKAIHALEALVKEKQ